MAPVAAVFINGDVAKAAGTVANVQKLYDARKDKGLQTFVVFVGGPELKEPIEKLAADQKITIPLTFLPGGPGDRAFLRYGINSEATTTYLLWKRGKVESNLVDVPKFEEVEKATDAMLQ